MTIQKQFSHVSEGKKVKAKEKKQEVRILSLDGGGILTCCYLTPVKGTGDNARPMKAENALNLYLKHGKSIFSKTFGSMLGTMFGLSEE